MWHALLLAQLPVCVADAASFGRRHRHAKYSFVQEGRELGGSEFRDDPGHTHARPRFPHYHHNITVLDGWWRYSFADGSGCEGECYPTTTESSAWVPEALPSDDPFSPSRGFALLETDIEVMRGHHGRLQFYGCAMRCRIQINGTDVGRHTGGFTVFWIDVPEGPHVLRVLVDSRLDGDQSGGLDQPWYDFLQYGGVVRPVILHHVKGPAMIENVHVVHGENDSVLRFRLHRFPGASAKEPVKVTVTSDYLPHPLSLSVDEDHLEHPVALQGARWSPADPKMAVLKMATDVGGVTVRTGLRHVTSCTDPSANAARVCIDGKPVKLLGFCMHNVDVHSRFTVPREKIRKDLQAALAAGGNFLRLVHYPHDLLTLELADELGILLWAETLGWGNHFSDLTSEKFREGQLTMLDEAVVETYNHPSVVLYGFLNEGENDREETCLLYQTLAREYRQHWKVGGLVTWASNKYQNDKCLGYAEAVAFNDYPGWYTGSVDSIASELGNYAAWATETYPHKPFIIAEVGASGIPPGVQYTLPPEPHPRGGAIGHWSEDYQAQVDGTAAEAVVCDGRIAGVSMWELFDTRTGEKRQSLRPRGFNNKGLLRENGEPKLAFTKVQQAYSQPCGAAAPLAALQVESAVFNAGQQKPKFMQRKARRTPAPAMPAAPAAGRKRSKDVLRERLSRAKKRDRADR
jgi:beta-glucuronidase